MTSHARTIAAAVAAVSASSPAIGYSVEESARYTLGLAGFSEAPEGMNTEEVIQLVLSVAAGLGLGTLLNSWLSQRWDGRRVGSEAIGKIMGQLVGVVGFAKDQIAENERVLALVKRGELSPDRAREQLCEDHMDIGAMVMGARIICEVACIDVQPLVIALEEFRLGAIEIMRRQKDLLGNENPDVQGENLVTKMTLADKERDLVNAAVAFTKMIKKTRF
jgi:hypothetical protein